MMMMKNMSLKTKLFGDEWLAFWRILHTHFGPSKTQKEIEKKYINEKKIKTTRLFWMKPILRSPCSFQLQECLHMFLNGIMSFACCIFPQKYGLFFFFE